MADYGSNTPLRIPRELTQRIHTAAKRLKISKQETMRLALAIGLEDLESIDYKVARIIMEAAKTEKAERAGS